MLPGFQLLSDLQQGISGYERALPRIVPNHKTTGYITCYRCPTVGLGLRPHSICPTVLFASARPAVTPSALCKDAEIDVLEHLNPTPIAASCKTCGTACKHFMPSPFISTSSDLVWVIRKALLETKRGKQFVSIAVINTSRLDPKSIYYVPPFHKEFARKALFNNGAQYYRAYSEYLVWNEIPSSAMIRTFALEQLAQFSESKPSLRDTLRLDKLGCAKNPRGEKSKTMKGDKIRTTDITTVAMAKIAVFLGIDYKATFAQLSCAVCVIAQVWALIPDGNSAGWFDHAMCYKNETL